jgi:DNA uptake protein ComE-like DNA-binding protein
MTHYTRYQLLLVLLLVGASGAGLAIEQWQRARPDLALRLETLDRVEPARAEVARPRRPPRDEPRPRAAPGADRQPARAAPLDVNHASEAELARLPGIGPALAARIVAARPFEDVDALRRVRGLRRSTLERLRPSVSAGVVAQPGP